MRLDRKDIRVLQQAANVAEAQRRLVKAESGSNTAISVAIGAAAGLVLLFLSGTMIHGLIESSQDQRAEQFVLNQEQERFFR
jgi:hypothetical protein